MLSALLPNLLFARWYEDSRYPLEVQILTSEFTPQDPAIKFPAECDLKHYSDACATGGTPAGTIKIKLVDSWAREYTLTCKADAHWSNCSPLPEKVYLKAKKHSNGYTIVSPDPAGKGTPYFYTYSGSSRKAPKSRSTAKRSTKQEEGYAAETNGTDSEKTAAPSAAGSEQDQDGEMIRCHITSTPDGAEISIDGHYVGNTPSEIGLPPGEHSVSISMEGYREWKRELRVTPGSAVNVTASLEQSEL
jgi:hypothetical protein